MTEKKRKGVAYNKAKDYWVASIYSKGQNYHLGSYKEFDAAVSIREQAESHLKAGDLPEWYAEFRKQNIKSEPSSHPGVFKSEGKWAAAIYFQNKSYHLGLYADVEDAIKIREKAERYKESGDFLEWFEKWKTTKPKKIREPKERTYKAEISYNKSKYLLGIFDTRFEASKTVEEAKKHLDSDFLRWYKENINITSPPDPQKKQTRKNWKNKHHAATCYFNAQSKKYRSTVFYNCQTYWLGCYTAKEDALLIRNEAAQHIQDGDFIKWYNENKQKFYKRKNLNYPEGIRPQHNKWRCSKIFNYKRYEIGLFDTLNEAVEARKEAEQHIEKGDFTEWFKTYKSDAVRRRELRKTQKVWNKYVEYNKTKKKYKAFLKCGQSIIDLGNYEDEQGAENICKVALQLINDEDFDIWYSELCKKIEDEKQRNGGIFYYKKTDKWVVRFPYEGKRYTLGSFSDKNDAIAVKLEALQHIDNFLEWYTAYRTSQKNTHGVVYKNERFNTWKTQINIQGKLYYLGTFKTEEDARKVLKEAETHVADFEDWYESCYVQGYHLAKRGRLSYDETSNTWKVKMHYKNKPYFLGQFQTKSEAEDTLKEARENYHTDFLKWYEENKEERKRNRTSGLIKISLDDATVYVISRLATGDGFSLARALRLFCNSNTYKELSTRENIYKADLPEIYIAYKAENPE